MRKNITKLFEIVNFITMKLKAHNETIQYADRCFKSTSSNDAFPEFILDWSNFDL